MKELPKLVFSKTLEKAGWNNSPVVRRERSSGRCSTRASGDLATKNLKGLGLDGRVRTNRKRRPAGTKVGSLAD
jgi:hypothetical protein